MRHLLRFVLLVIIGVTVSAGCSRTSPAAGIWSGTAKVSQPKVASGPMDAARFLLGTSMNGPCTLTLKADGTGFIKVPIAPERPILWSEEDNKVIIHSRFEEKATSGQSKTEAQNGSSLVGTLSEDNQTMIVDFGITKVELKKQTDAK